MGVGLKIPALFYQYVHPAETLNRCLRQLSRCLPARNVADHGGDALARAIQFAGGGIKYIFTSAIQHDVGALREKLAGCLFADAAAATSNENDFIFEFHGVLLLYIYV